MIIRHFSSSIQSSEKEIGEIGIDLAAVRREMEAEREKERNEREKEKEEFARKSREMESEREKMKREMEEMKRMNEGLIEKGRQQEEKEKEKKRRREQERKRKKEEENEREKARKEGAAAIEVFSRDKFTLSGHIFTKSVTDYSYLFSLSFGPVVVRITFVITNCGSDNFHVGLIATDMIEQAVSQTLGWFSDLKKAAGWYLHPEYRCSRQNGKKSHIGSACKAGAVGQRVVLEADGREGKRTLKLSQDGETQPVFFSNIPVPFRFAIQIYESGCSVEIASSEVLKEASMVGGSLEVVMD
ncbi:hypothetical protein BLNAU_20490 [Blattamonas nauphoetae]|uniref:Uncharacterized protein n=1 Tax=Blattamonas nauphoetae TaxID=2049346 RepID=A0ABQ9WZ43_9EUKA|nr:hypothetical protein BLNAU_20490 [Blattamonas nauphoetae]